MSNVGPFVAIMEWRGIILYYGLWVRDWFRFMVHD